MQLAILLIIIIIIIIIIIVIIIIITIIIHLFNIDRSKHFTMKNIYVAVAITTNHKDGMLIKVNKNKKKYKQKQNTMVRRIS